MSTEYTVGMIWMGDEEHSIPIKQDEEGNFLNTESELLDWAYFMNDPWSDTSIHYNVFPNYQNPAEWVCQKTVIVYDNVEIVVAARGDTPQSAISNCEDFIKEVTEKYCPEEE